MFILNLENGETLIEGHDVADWASVPHDVKVVAVTLTDGFKLQQVLKGYDFYVVCYEAIVQATHTATGEFLQVTEGKDCAQIAYGIRLWSDEKRKIQKIANLFRFDIDQVFTIDFVGNNALLIKARAMAIRELEEKTKRFFENLAKAEVSEVKLGLSFNTFGAEELKQDRHSFKEGLPLEVFTESKIKEILDPTKY